MPKFFLQPLEPHIFNGNASGHNIPAVNILNRISETAHDMHVLLVRCGDLRNVIASVNSDECRDLHRRHAPTVITINDMDFNNVMRISITLFLFTSHRHANLSRKAAVKNAIHL